jgi:uncharacterized protein involved in exopolysaccharide biosynthesis
MMASKSTKDYLSILSRRRRTIAAVVLSSLTVTLLLSLVLPRYYESKATFYLPIYQGKQIYLAASPKEITKTKVAIPVSSDVAIQGVLQILLSRKVASEVEEIVPERTADDIQANANINVSSEGIYTLKFKDRDAETSARIANSYPLAASRFLEDETGIGRGAQSVKAFIENQLSVFQARADTTNAHLNDFLKNHEVIAVDQEVKKMMDLYATWRTQKFTTQLSLLENRIKMDALNEQMDLAGADVLENLLGTNQVILDLRGKAANLEIRIAELKQTYTEEHPEIIALRAAQQETQARLRDEVQKIFESYTESANPIVGTMKEEYINDQIKRSILLAKSDLLDSSIQNLEDSFLGLSNIQYEFAKLNKESTMLDRLITSLLLKLEELKFQELQSANRFVILDEASTPTKPAYPNLAANLLISLMLSLLAAALISLWWDSRESKQRAGILEASTAEDLKGVFIGD